MATSSMHKPSWRSRRRSRLSLVERAVPSLGRLPASDESARPAQPELADGAGDHAGRMPATTHEETSKEIDSKAGADGAGLPSTVPSSDPADLPALPTTAVALRDADDLAVEQEPRFDRRDAEEISWRTSDEDDAKDGAANSAFSDRQADAEVDDDIEQLISEDEPASSTIADTADDSAPEQDTSTTLLNAQPDERSTVEDEPSALEEDRQEAVEFTEPVFGVALPASSPDLTLDWAALVSQGFTDPRDRSQPLPANMGQIARALVRQALSDQSSWRDRIILVTSPREQRAKTIAAINFALALTTVDRHSVVLVDADVDNAGAVERLGGDVTRGLTTALCDDDIDIADLVVETDLDRLTLLASGLPQDDTLDRFASRRMLQVLRFLTKDPETILVIDAPPILLSQEAAVLSIIAGQVVLVVEAGQCTADAIDHALQRIGDRHNIALVLNESSGFDSDEASGPVGAKVGARAETADETQDPQIRRRLPKAIAAATILAIFIGFAAWFGTTLTGSQGLNAQAPLADLSDSTMPGRVMSTTATVGHAW